MKEERALEYDLSFLSSEFQLRRLEKSILEGTLPGPDGVPETLAYIEGVRHDDAMMEKAARAALLEDNVEYVVVVGDTTHGFVFILENWRRLLEDGLLERAFFAAWSDSIALPLSDQRWLASRLDREKLLALGEALPVDGPFTCYRGVSGNGSARRCRGLSWTGDFERAKWFSTRSYLPKPAVLETTVTAEHVLFYTNEMEEDEYVLLLPPHHPIRTVWKGIASKRGQEP